MEVQYWERPVEVKLEGRGHRRTITATCFACECLLTLWPQDHGPAYRAAVLGTAPRVAVEAGTPFGWTRYVASEDDVVGMTSFGASGPYKALYEHFGLTAEAIATKVRELVEP